MRHKKSPGLQKAIAYISQRIVMGQFAKGERLTTVKALALEADVSHVTMNRAIQVLKKQGVLSGAKGFCARVARMPREAGGEAAAIKTAHHAGLKVWEKIRDQIRTSILNGIYTPGDLLPDNKELRRTYGVSFHTVRKALDALLEENLLVPRGRGYAVRSLSSGISHKKIVLLASWFGVPGMALGALDEEFLHVVEYECSKSGISLDIVGISHYGGIASYFDVHSGIQTKLEPDEEVLGYMWLMTYAQPVHDQVLVRLKSLGKPIAVWDQVRSEVAERFAAQIPTLRIYRNTIGTHSARDVARFLMSLGHRTIAYISPFHKAPWSVERYDIIVREYRDAGLKQGATPFVLEEYEAFADFDRASRSNVDLFEAWKKQFSKGFAEGAESTIGFALRQVGQQGEVFRVLEPLFAKALKRSDISAWVLANDLVAAMALEYLNHKGAKVPDTVSLVGFDDSSLAVKNRITSYNFNVPTVSRSMLQYVLNPRYSLGARLRRIVIIEGTIVERMTTGRKRLSIEAQDA